MKTLFYVKYFTTVKPYDPVSQFLYLAKIVTFQSERCTDEVLYIHVLSLDKSSYKTTVYQFETNCILEKKNNNNKKKKKKKRMQFV